ncbi:GNAT family N-acetyltransferase [Bacillus pseudomycoides]|uniref:GNAT family N-acetyltransferase n=1 Tax=Bacillus bingmayongensis TaxID=1150157 RepID=A0ABU5K491_9BACI|nr:GNAT family N-acetyltransferase [Bacillus pseudomycoides]
MEIDENTKEISLRALKLEDYDVVLNWNKDERFCEANGWQKNRDKDELLQWWNHCVSKKRNDFIRFGIEFNNRLIGYADLAEIKNNSAEIGIAIGDSELWGMGIGTQTVNLLINPAVKELRITIFYGETHETNLRSRKMLEKLGFTEVSHIGSEIYLDKEVKLIQYKLCLEE